MSGIAPYNYIKLIDQFVPHWTLVNAALAPSALTLAGGCALSNLQSERAALVLQIAAVEAVTSNETAQLLGEVKDINVLTFASAKGLNVAGNKVAVKCFVETLEGNEAGSNVVVITRS